ncbi:MAG: glucokinase [Paracoccaceae bacterium]
MNQTNGTEPFGLVADVGGTNTRLARVGAFGVLKDSVTSRPNKDVGCFDELVCSYLKDAPQPKEIVIAVAGPVDGKKARLTNRNWDFDADSLGAKLGANRVKLINDLEALAKAVPTIAPDAVEPLHEGAQLRQPGQALVVGLGTGFNVAAVDTSSGATFSAELGHASLPAPVLAYLEQHVPDTSSFESVENLFSGIGLLNLGRVMGINAESAKDIAQSDDPNAKTALDIVTVAFGLMVREIAYMYFPRAGIFFNGSMARTLLAPDRSGRVLEPLRSDQNFDGQFARLPAYLIVSDSVALGGCAAHLLGES